MFYSSCSLHGCRRTHREVPLAAGCCVGTEWQQSLLQGAGIAPSRRNLRGSSSVRYSVGLGGRWGGPEGKHVRCRGQGRKTRKIGSWVPIKPHRRTGGGRGEEAVLWSPVRTQESSRKVWLSLSLLLFPLDRNGESLTLSSVRFSASSCCGQGRHCCSLSIPVS